MKLVQLNEDLEHLSDELKDKVAVALDDTQAQVALEADDRKEEVKKDTKPAVDVTNEVAKETNADGEAKEIFESVYSVKDLDDKEVEEGSKHDSKGIRNIVVGSLADASKEDLLSSIRDLLNKADDETVIKLLKSLNNYDIKKLKEDVEDVVIDKEEVIDEPKEFGLNSAITQLIKQGWENIDQVNSYLATFENAPEGVKNALQSIVDDNMIHIGALEGLLNLNPEVKIEDEEEKLELK